MLVTADVMEMDSMSTISILEWFTRYSKTKSPGTWKLVLRPNVQNWLLDKASDSDDVR